MNYILETERLSLRKFTMDDAPFIITLLNTPGWLQYIGDKNIKTEEQAKEYLQNGPLTSYKVNGFGLSLVELRAEKIPLGMCGILKRDTMEHPEIGFAFLPEFTGKGYAFEIADATMKYAENTLKLSPVLAITIADNHGSIKLLEKIGFKFSKMIHSPANEELMLLSN